MARETDVQATVILEMCVIDLGKYCFYHANKDQFGGYTIECFPERTVFSHPLHALPLLTTPSKAVVKEAGLFPAYDWILTQGVAQ